MTELTWVRRSISPSRSLNMASMSSICEKSQHNKILKDQSDCKRVHHVTNTVHWQHTLWINDLHWTEKQRVSTDLKTVEGMWGMKVHLHGETSAQKQKHVTQPVVRLSTASLLCVPRGCNISHSISNQTEQTEVHMHDFQAFISRWNLLCLVAQVQHQGLISFLFCFIFYQRGNNRSCTSLVKSGQSCTHITWSQCRKFVLIIMDDDTI